MSTCANSCWPYPPLPLQSSNLVATFPSPFFIAPKTLRDLLLGHEELALLDVREARAHVTGHLNLARLAPLSGLELEVRALVPRLDTLVVLADGGEPTGPALLASELLHRLGYTEVHVLAGGTAAWLAAGFQLIDGYGTLVKAFGDLVRRHYATPTLNGDALRADQAARNAATFIDVRPAGEYAFLSLPGAGNHAGTELALRRWPAVVDTDAPGRTWVVNCFSRTRGIIGTTTLRLLGHTDAYFLEDGVMQWALDGAPVVQNAIPGVELPEASNDVLRRRAQGLIDRYQLPLLQPDALLRFQAEDHRTLYVFDLRPQAAAHGPHAGVRAVPGGQLLMHFENLIGTRHARIVLLDDTHRLRAAVTAFWLVQLNQAEVFILDGALPPTWRADRHGDGVDIGISATAPQPLTPHELTVLLHDTPDLIHIVDVGPSIEYERQHLPHASFMLPVTLEPLEPLVAWRQSGHRIVFTSPDGRAARLAARDACARWPGSNAAWLRGGTQEWRAAGLPVEQAWDAAQRLTPFDDDWGSVMRVPATRRDRAWRDYLAWERGLSARVLDDPTVRFRLF